jgi:hypothetical protein
MRRIVDHLWVIERIDDNNVSTVGHEAMARLAWKRKRQDRVDRGRVGEDACFIASSIIFGLFDP